MNQSIIICPNCKTEIKLTESLAAPLIEATRRQFEQQLAQKEADVARRESEIALQRENIETQVASRLLAEREKIVAEEGKKARLVLANDLDQSAKEVAGLKEVLQERETKLAEAQQAQAELIRKQRELDDAKRELDLIIEKRVEESLTVVREKATKDAEEGLNLKVREKETQIASMQRQIEELRRKADQGSQQLQGEVQELELEDLIRSRFPLDIVEPVAKGEFGGDVLHRVFSPTGKPCGTILWEIKRTRNWSEGWLAKLRNDQRSAKAEIALIVSHALPKGVESFDLVDGVWVTAPRHAIAVAVALRESLIGLATARQAGEGQVIKAELVYQYLTGPRFRHRVEAIVEKFSEMHTDLDRERKAMTRLWAKREEQIRGVVESTAGMYGDLQGIAGQTLQEIEGLELQLLDEPKDHPEDKFSP